jgi:hypothetical protein
MGVVPFWTSVVVLAVLSGDALAQTYTIKLKSYPGKGMTVTVRDTDKEQGSIKYYDATGQLVNEVKAKTRELVYADTTLERDKPDEPARLYKTVYTTAVETEAGEQTIKSYQGRTLLYERTDGKYRVGVAGMPALATEDLEDLLERANKNPGGTAKMDRLLSPAVAVKIGENWTLDEALLADALGMAGDLDLKQTKGVAKLIKAQMVGKRLMGVIQVNLTLAVKGSGKDIQFDPPLMVDLEATVDTAIDGSASARTEVLTSKGKGKIGMKRGDMTYTVVFDMQSVHRVERSEEKDDSKAREVPKVVFAEPAGDWKEFTSKEGKFTVTFPGTPKAETKKDGNGTVTTTYSVVLEKGSIYYMAAFTDYVGDAAKAEPKVMLKNLADSLAKNAKQKKDIQLGDYPGIEMVSELEEMGVKVAMKHRIYFLNGRLYQVVVVSEARLAEKAQFDRFLDSLKLAGQK